MKKVIAVCACWLGFVLHGLAQQQVGSITGAIRSNNDKPIENTTVLLLKEKDSSVTRSAITNKSGEFEFSKVPLGSYFVRTNALGYAVYSGKVFTISAIHNAITLAPFKLEVQANNLGEVTVAAAKPKPFIENKLDKTVVNVDASPTNTGLSALEILEKSPGITIDNNDNINLKGKQGVVILLDGKPAYLSGKDLSNYLRNLPANQLDQVEIMTQPSSKYDAAGNSGVINIKTKKNKANGFNANISASAIFAQYFKNTNSINFNWRKNKLNLFGNYGYSNWVGFNDINIYRSFRKDENSAYNRYFDQNTFGKFTGYPHEFKLGADYYASKKTTIGVLVSGSVDNRQFSTSGVSNIYDSIHQFVQYNASSSSTKDPWTNVGFNVNLRQLTDSKGGELTADADYIFYNTDGRQYSDNYLYDNNNNLVEDPYLLNGYLPARINIYSFKADYSKPLAKDVKLEAGIKSSYVTTDNNAIYTAYDQPSQKWLSDTTRSNHFIYKENINAAYVNVNKQWKKFKMQLGVRAEQTIAKGDQVIKNSSFDRNYIQLFPTAYFSYAKNDKHTFSVSYGRRLERPGYQDLNPFQYLLDRYTYQEGNPNLQPQFSHNVELGYNYKGQLNVSANYTVTSNIINDILLTQKSGENYITYQTKDNIASNYNIGLAINYNKQLLKWWSLNVFGNVYNNRFVGVIAQQPVDVSYTGYSGNISNQFNFGKGWSGEISGFYNSKNLVSSVILADPMGMFSIGGGKQILKNKGSIRVNVRDPFYLMHFHGTTTMNTFFTEINSKWDNRRVIITFTYKFGKPLQAAPQRRKGASLDEQSRVNTGGQNG
ncbi:MAG: TonB-dependent receptor [Bacteroidota bacterium]|nr:TonB-dependent receptor [Bacteroidota bacterium]